ncbi:MazG family protein [Jonquetella anthropi DSM 22815]|uniref:MazG family protein n=1 Tax=Jonquetella anthropi DSM 22815 TaxID=885272 RepID=H0UII7_9BACT|nr:nucleoside triphosphate pyrophosphohydrolase [Jonquetella anthropi]EHM12695.1 MazG family protein [Jonquetella anthropi DSM 22815]
MAEYGFDRLVKIMEQLRAPGGCPWDRKQTYDTLCANIVEEAYELVDAIHSRQRDGTDHMVEGCGDLLLQVVFISTIASELGDFSVADPIKAICDKLIRRHPHIFGESRADTPEEVLAKWEAIKASERAAKGKADESILSGVPRSLPASVKALRIQQKAASVGFDWKKGDSKPVLDKIKEELAEVEAALGDQEQLTDEIGDLLFAVINLARRHHVDPDSALARTNDKFIRRFGFVEGQVRADGRKWEDFTLEELDKFWEMAKAGEQQV